MAAVAVVTVAAAALGLWVLSLPALLLRQTRAVLHLTGSRPVCPALLSCIRQALGLSVLRARRDSHAAELGVPPRDKTSCRGYGLAAQACWLGHNKVAQS